MRSNSRNVQRMTLSVGFLFLFAASSIRRTAHAFVMIPTTTTSTTVGPSPCRSERVFVCDATKRKGKRARTGAAQILTTQRNINITRGEGETTVDLPPMTVASKPARYATVPVLDQSSNNSNQRQQRRGSLGTERSEEESGGAKETFFDNLLARCVVESDWDSVLAALTVRKDDKPSSLDRTQQLQGDYRACLAMCYETANAVMATIIFDAMQTNNVTVDVSDVSIVVRTICRADQSQQRRLPSALTYLQQYEHLGALPVEAYNDVLAGLRDARDWKQSVRLLRQLTTESSTTTSNASKPALSTYKIVVECCVQSGQPEQAFQVLMSCVRNHLVPSSTLFELVISSLCRKLQWRRALQLFDTMDQLQVPKPLAAYNSVLSATAKTADYILAKSLLQRMKQQDGLSPTVLSYNAVLAACASARQWQDALAVLDQCHRQPGVSPDIYTYTHAIRACAKAGKVDRALSLLQVAKDRRLPVDAYCYTAAMEACAKAKLWKKAMALLEEMESNNVPPSHVTYSVAISACGNGCNWETAMELLDRMRQKNMPINSITYNSAIAALSKAAKLTTKRNQEGNTTELWRIALDMLERMKLDGIQPDGFSYSSAISCCGAAGAWEEALKLIQVMQGSDRSIQPNKIAYTAAIASCGKAGQLDHAVRLFQEMLEQGLSPDRVAYNSLFTAFRVSSEGILAFELWSDMVSKRLTNSNSKRVSPRADDLTSPDIITVTEAIAAMNRGGLHEKVDMVFADAVQLGILFQDDSFDTCWEVDLTKMSLSVARAACRFILRRAAKIWREGADVDDLIFITGVGRNSNHDTDHPSLREYVQEILLSDFTPPIKSGVPRLASGTVVLDKARIVAWACEQ